MNYFKKSGFNLRNQDNEEEDSDPEFSGWSEEPDFMEWSVNAATSLNINLKFRDYVAVDQDVVICGEWTDDDIVAAILIEDSTKSEDEEEDEDPPQPVTVPNLKEARLSIDVLKRLFENKSVLSDVVRCINEFDVAIDEAALKSNKQSKIGDYFVPVSQ